MRSSIQSLITVLALVMWIGQGEAQDVLIADFDGTNYDGWTVTGTAFGTGPAKGTLLNQQTVSGYAGEGLVNSFNGGDTAIGTLTSPGFIIQRKYLRFLIGGGNQRGKTCLNLIVNGQLVRSAVGMGDRETLTPLQWNVSEFAGSNAVIQIVDAATNGWGHLNVDQIVQTDATLGSVVTISNRYLNLPVKTGATKRLFELVVEGLVTHEFNIELADTVTPDFWVFLDLKSFMGKEALVRIDSTAASATSLGALAFSNGILEADTFYHEAVRPIYHFTMRRGWLNDPNGLVWYNGEYHMGMQHNPYGWNWDNMHWGHAVSPDLVHWTELPEWFYPDPLGAMWSGSAVVDDRNSAGFGTNALVAFYTAAGGPSGVLPRMSNGERFTQCMAYSLDAGRNWVKYTNNPVVPNLGGDNRDPKVCWYAPSNKWVMCLWLNGNDFGFFSSTNLRSWVQTSTFTFPNVIEVPDLFQLALDGNTNNPSWVFLAGAGNYYLGSFDGNGFTAQSGPFSIRNGNCFAATQSFNDIPAADGRRIYIVHGTAQFPGMPFNNNINFPTELTLRTTASGPRMFVSPVGELARLRLNTNSWAAQTLAAGSNVMNGVAGEAFELDATFKPGGATQVTFLLRGTTVTYDRSAQTVSCAGTTKALPPVNGAVRLQMLVDRGTVEIFGNDGWLYMPMRVTATAGAGAVTMTATGSGAQLVSMNMYLLGSAWNFSATNSPVILSQPTPVGINPGGAAFFSVSASGSPPLSYQWRRGGLPLSNSATITGVTSNTLRIVSASASNGGSYDVVITNNFGSVTSSAAGLTVFLSPTILTPPASTTVNLGGLAGFSVAALGGTMPLTYQWRGNSQLIGGATNSSLSLFPVRLSDGGDYDVVVGGSGSCTSSVAKLAVRLPHRVGHWAMEAQITTPNTSGSLVFNGVGDACTNNGEGVAAVGTVVAASRDDLITFSSLSGNPVTLSNNVPPAEMFTGGYTGGSNSFNAAAFAGGDGALFFPADQYGDEFSFTSPFSIELFFRTHGDQSGAGTMQLVMQGENTFRYGLSLNEAAPGGVSFMVTNGVDTRAVCVLTNVNYADGQWHYLLASYDTLSGTNGRLQLTVADASGKEAHARVDLPAAFGPLSAGTDGNLFIGRFRYPITAEHRTFLGLIDEVQITAGVVSNQWRLGKIASWDQPPRIVLSGNAATGLRLEWPEVAGGHYRVQWNERLGDEWQEIASLSGTGSVADFLDTNLDRMTNPTGFYRLQLP